MPPGHGVCTPAGSDDPPGYEANAVILAHFYLIL